MIRKSAILVALAVAAAVANAADMTPILDNGPDVSPNQERANKAMGLMLHRTLFAEGDPQLAADMVMDANFINHDIEEASGGQGFANFFLKPTEYKNPNPRAGGAPHAASPASLMRLFIVTDNDITMMAYPTREGDLDPGARFASNMMEVKHGRVTQWWYSGPTNSDTSARPAAAPGGAGGPPAGANAAGAPGAAPGAAAPGGKPPGGAAGAAPRAAETTPDYSKWYPQMGPITVSMQSIIPLGETTTRAQRDANKKLVATFFDEFFNKKNYAVADRYLSADLKNHIANAPSGKDFAGFAQKNQKKVTADRTDAVLFLLAEGELVDIGWPAPQNGDPGAWYGQNLLRVKDGKIVEWWYSGFPYGSPRTGVNPFNKLGYSPAAQAVIDRK
ncbi:MAG: hypothetical protein QM718_11480 [Steroidobacteraceae bacterium]